MPSLKNGNPITANSPSALSSYLLASRPKTWIASFSPVFIGTVMADRVDLTLFLLTLLFSLLIQIGANFANDYFDFVNGADTIERVGPKRATQQGWIQPKAMLRATCIVFATALLVAIPLMIQAGLWSLFAALTCIAFGMLYTGGPKPLGYLGLGELLVLLFFGPVATCGTYFLQMHTVSLPSFIASLAPGLLSCSILIANNLRDQKTDQLAKKNTLVVRFGNRFGNLEYSASLLLSALVPLMLGKYLALLAFIPALFLIKKAFRENNALLQPSAFILIFYTALFCLS